MWGRTAKACLACLYVALQPECERRSAPPRRTSSPLMSLCISPPFILHASYVSSSTPFLSSGLWPVPSGIDHPSGFQGCLPGVSQRLRRGEDGSGLRCPLVLERRAGSTMDSASPQAVSILRPCLPAIWAPASAAGDSQSPLSLFPLPRGLSESSTGVPAPQPASNCQTENPRPGLGVWRPW